jgi:hypothetical protein
MVIPQMNASLEKDVTNIVAMLYENVTVDNEDCKSSGLDYTCCAEHLSNRKV